MPRPAYRLLPNYGEMNLQFVANEENQDRAQRGKNESGGRRTICSSLLIFPMMIQVRLNRRTPN